MPHTHPFYIYPSTQLAEMAAGLIAKSIQQAVKRRGAAHMAISGGSTPRDLFRLLASDPWQSRIPWPDLHIWWVDERCVPPDDPESNYGVAYTLLLSHLPLYIAHRIHGELEDPWQAAQLYENELRSVFRLGPRARPRFDLILLGMGPDGHTASLFPGTPALDERTALVTVGQAPSPPHQRITLTLPVLNRAALVLFLVAGQSKGPALRQIFDPSPDQAPLPASLVQPRRGRVLWFLDESAAAAAQLSFSSKN
ncbi:MAG: 6-phosphogluconolactonase [Chloroflexi bacterium]|nr:6-phosphogluconolactonase [Chloroflexota bacterium]